MARPKNKKRFGVKKLSKNYWVIYFDELPVGYVSVGSRGNYYYANKDRIVLEDNFMSMPDAFTAFMEKSLEFDERKG